MITVQARLMTQAVLTMKREYFLNLGICRGSSMMSAVRTLMSKAVDVQ